MSLPPGKVSPYELVKLIFPHLDLRDEKVLVGPKLGVDASVVEIDDGVLVLSSDPITGTLRNPGWLSVHVNANDVSTMGASPRWFLMNIFLPEGSERTQIETLVKEAENACRELNVSLVGGHTEVTPGLNRILISGTMVGKTSKNKWVSATGAESGDRIILTKSAAIEGTFILASDRENELRKELSSDLIERAQRFKEKISVVKDALTAVDAGEVHAMHDPTEGGLVGGLHELADASESGFLIDSNSVPVSEETLKICEYFGMDPLKTIGSGSLLICAASKDSDNILKALKKEGISAAEIGEILEDKKIREVDGENSEYPTQDELWRVFKTN